MVYLQNWLILKKIDSILFSTVAGGKISVPSSSGVKELYIEKFILHNVPYLSGYNKTYFFSSTEKEYGGEIYIPDDNIKIKVILNIKHVFKSSDIERIFIYFEVTENIIESVEISIVEE